jgi:endonuclease IV
MPQKEEHKQMRHEDFNASYLNAMAKKHSTDIFNNGLKHIVDACEAAAYIGNYYVRFYDMKILTPELNVHLINLGFAVTIHEASNNQYNDESSFLVSWSKP